MKRLKVLSKGLEDWQVWMLFDLLTRRYDVEFLEPDDLHSSPDLFFYGAYLRVPPLSKELDRVNCLRVAVITENIKPNFKFFDYAFSFEETDDKNFQLPFFCNSRFFEEFRTGRYGDEVKGFRQHPKDRFCNFIHSDTKNQKRAVIYKKLAAYKKVDCPGEAFNNMPPIGPSPRDKFNLIQRHKFTVAFENRSSPNYVTEKIYHALLVNSVPIYWGSPRIAEYFNPEAFINCHDYDSLDRAVDRVIEVDNDDELYRRYAEVPPVLEGSKAHVISEEAVTRRLEKIVESIGTAKPVVTTPAYKRRLPFYRFVYGAVQWMYPLRIGYLNWKWKLQRINGLREIFTRRPRN